MLTEKVKSNVALRLGLYVKYSISGGFYFSTQTNRFIPIQSYREFLWCSTYYLGQSFLIGLAANLISRILINLEIPEDQLNFTENKESQVDTFKEEATKSCNLVIGKVRFADLIIVLVSLLLRLLQALF